MTRPNRSRDFSQQPPLWPLALCAAAAIACATPLLLMRLLDALDAHDPQVCAFANNTHQPDPWEDS